MIFKFNSYKICKNTCLDSFMLDFMNSVGWIKPRESNIFFISLMPNTLNIFLHYQASTYFPLLTSLHIFFFKLSMKPSTGFSQGEWGVMVSMLILLVFNKSLTRWVLCILTLSHTITTLLFWSEYFLLSSATHFTKCENNDEFSAPVVPRTE